MFTSEDGITSNYLLLNTNIQFQEQKINKINNKSNVVWETHQILEKQYILYI